MGEEDEADEAGWLREFHENNKYPEIPAEPDEEVDLDFE